MAVNIFSHFFEIFIFGKILYFYNFLFSDIIDNDFYFDKEGMMLEEKALLIAGGVAAGTAAASRARRTDKTLKIDLFERGTYISYSS